jgi:hypothetical protein
MVMFGGNLGTSFDVLSGFVPTDETWQLSGGTAWTQVTTSGTKPAGRYLAGAALDGKRNRLLVYGGCCDNMGGFYGDTWALDLATDTWSMLDDGSAANAPTPRIGASAAYDAAGDRLVIFAGHDGGSLGNVNDTWALPLTGTQGWQQLTAGDQPDQGLGCAGNDTEAPFNFTMVDPKSPERRERAFFIAGDRLLLGGGEGDCAQLDDTWVLAGATWTKLIPASQGESCARRGEQCACLCN